MNDRQNREKKARCRGISQTFFSGALPAGAFPAVVGFFSAAALGGILGDCGVWLRGFEKGLQSVGGDEGYVVWWSDYGVDGIERQVNHVVGELGVLIAD